MTACASNHSQEQGDTRHRFAPEDEQQLRDERRRCGTHRDALNERGVRVMQWAEWYATTLGLEVMPGSVDSKHGNQKRPCGRWALVTNDVDEIRAFGGAWNGGLIFTPTGHQIVALDVDTKNGKGGKEDLAALEQKYGPLPQTARWRTPSGGEQILFRPGANRIPKSVAALGKRFGEAASGLDVIAIGAMTVLPGSERPDGIVEWLQSPDMVGIAVLPKWLADLMLKAASAHRTQQNDAHQRSTFAWGADNSGTASNRAEMWLRKAIVGMAKAASIRTSAFERATCRHARQEWVDAVKKVGDELSCLLDLVGAGLSPHTGCRCSGVSLDRAQRVQLLEYGLRQLVTTEECYLSMAGNVDYTTVSGARAQAL